MRRVFLFLLLFVAVLTSAETLNLQQVREIALRNNPTYKAAQSKTSASKWSYRQSMMGLIPNAKLEGRYRSTEPGTTLMTGDVMDYQTTYGFSASQPIFVGGSIWLGSRISRDSWKIAEASLQNTTLSVVAEAETKYFNVLKYRDLLAIAEKNLEYARGNEFIAKTRFESGTISQADYLQMQSDRANKEVALLQMQNLVRVSRADLANHLQIEGELTITPLSSEELLSEITGVKALSQPAVEQAVTRILTLGVEQNPSLKISSLGVSIGKKTRLIAQGQFLPSIALSYSKEWSAWEDEAHEDTATLMLNASMSTFPMFGKFARVQSAKYSLRQALMNHRTAEDGVRLGITNAVYTMVTAASSVETSKIALDFSRETFRQMEIRFRNNLVSATDMLNVQIMLSAAENQYSTALYDYLEAKSGLMLLTGADQTKLLKILMAIELED
ncbi:MAG: TolC family protein [Candidatus Cloacimonetes bacterium]|nr:TolC family protein [Candidatus Cloacimonadota bacterium]